MKAIKIQFIVILMCLTACEDFVDVELPNSQLTGSTVFEDRNTANAAMTEVYTKLRENGFLNGGPQGTPASLGLYADELVNYAGSASSGHSLYTNSLLPSTGLVTSMWNEAYHQVYLANAVLQGVQNSVSLEAADKDQLRGEALFVRALVHFYLVNVYGDIPYIETTDYQQNRLVARMPEATVYEKITADLEESAALLPEDYFATFRTRPNRSAALALLARTYLYMGLWAEASNAASAVINNPLYVWETDPAMVFRKESGSVIWQFRASSNGKNTKEAASFIFTTVPPPTMALSEGLVDALEAGDLRAQWIAEVTDGTNSYYHAYKYKALGNTGSSIEYSIVLRLAEQYLIRAEARAQQGELTAAKDDLNKVRLRGGLANTTAVTAEELVEAVLQERRVEFFTEYGHRFFDLKRTGRLDAILTPVKAGWNTTDRLWPLPETELLVNPNLSPQNSGY